MSLESKPLECLNVPTIEPIVENCVKITEPETPVSDIKENLDWSFETPETVECDEFEPIQLKRTTKRKFTLGKKNNKIGVLIKNKRTKKNALEYSKDLKKITTEEIKKYLRDHGLIKVGSSAPPEIVRKIFENTKMAGDIVNETNILNNLIYENN